MKKKKKISVKEKNIIKKYEKLSKQLDDLLKLVRTELKTLKKPKK